MPIQVPRTVNSVNDFNRAQTRRLMSDIDNASLGGTFGPVSDLQFSNLVIGQKYRISGLLFMLSANNDSQHGLTFEDGNGTTYGSSQNGANVGNANTSVIAISPAIEFTALTSELMVFAVSITGSTTILGNGVSETFLTLTELNNTNEVTDFTP